MNGGLGQAVRVAEATLAEYGIDITSDSVADISGGAAGADRESAPCPRPFSSNARAKPVLGFATSLGPVSTRITILGAGVPVGSLVASGAVALGFQQRSELIGLAGITLLGDLPAPVQIHTIFSGAVAATSQQPDAVRALLAWLASPATADTKQRQGMAAA